VVVLAAGLVALAIALAAAPGPPPAGEAERAHVRRLVQDPASGSLAPFATRADRTYVFSARGDAAIGYRVRFGVALAGGDPVGADPAAAITAFARLCDEHGWRPAVLGNDAAATGDLWRAAGVRRAVEIGDEAVLDIKTFSAAGRAMRNVRQAAQRAENAGVRVDIGPLDPLLIPALDGVLRDWLRGRTERGFAMNLDALLTPRDGVLLAVARTAGGEPVAFARFAVAASGRILTLDVAPRRRDAPNGVVERMILATVAYAQAHDATEVTLNFAGMRRVYAGVSLGARLLQVPLHALDRWIELRSLWLFTDKFHPRWRARQLRMRSWWELVPVAFVALTAECGARPTPAPVVETPPAGATVNS
jgi:lysyl-tRNA synthetase class 2